MVQFTSLDDVQFKRLPVDKENTEKAVEMVIKIFRSSLVEKGFSPDFESLSHIQYFTQLCYSSSNVTINGIVNLREIVKNQLITHYVVVEMKMIFESLNYSIIK